MSAPLCAAAVPLAWVHTGIALGIYLLVASLGLLPDPRIESKVDGESGIHPIQIGGAPE